MNRPTGRMARGKPRWPKMPPRARPCLICRSIEDSNVHSSKIGTVVLVAGRRVYSVHAYDPGERRRITTPSADS